MASCYGTVSRKDADEDFAMKLKLSYLPIKAVLQDGTQVELDFFRESEHEAGRKLLNDVIDEGRTWPFENVLDMPSFRSYFLSHAAFVVRTSPTTSPASSSVSASGSGSVSASASATARDGNEIPGGSALGNDEVEPEGSAGEVWGAFYIKPNFPGRCSHICNGGFITEPRRRRRGVARLMGHAFLRIARDLGYKGSYFNLVFSTNEASLRLWRSLGFKELAVVPRAASLKGIHGLVDAIQFYFNLEELRDEDLPHYIRG